MRSSRNSRLSKMVLSAMFLAIAMVLPFLTGQIPQIGSMLCPMHLPVFLCGFFCGPLYGLAVGVIAPFLRFFLFGMPPLVPTGVAMSAELATYGLISGLLYRVFPRKKGFIYVSLILSMLAGRAVWGAVHVLLAGLSGSAFGWSAFVAGAFTKSFPGIIVQLILIPLLVMALDKAVPPSSDE